MNPESYIRKNEENTDDTPQAQNTEVKQADALCGPEKHAQKDTESAVKRKIPPGKSRVQVDDVVYQRYTGKYLDMQGIMMQLTLELCNLMKSVLNSKRHLQNEKNREMIAKTVHNDDEWTRDGKMIDEMDEKGRRNDKFNPEFQRTEHKLCTITIPMMFTWTRRQEQQQQQSGTRVKVNPMSPSVVVSVTPKFRCRNHQQCQCDWDIVSTSTTASRGGGRGGGAWRRRWCRFHQIALDVSLRRRR